jgi:hypothetical protein
MLDRDLGLYILDSDGEPKKVHNILEWTEWSRNPDNKRVAETFVGEARISTVFLAMDWNVGDYNYQLGKPATPILYETMIFGGVRDSDVYRWKTKQEALTGHQQIVDDLMKARTLHD